MLYNQAYKSSKKKIYLKLLNWALLVFGIYFMVYATLKSIAELKWNDIDN